MLDHSGAVYRHGLPEDFVEWTLDVDSRAVNPKQEARARGDEHELRECPSCKVLMYGPPPCHNCGWEPAPPRGRDVDVADGELGLVIGGRARAPVYDLTERRHWHAMLRGAAVERGKNPNAAYYWYRDKFGHKPDWSWRGDSAEPTNEVRRFVKSRLIAFAKSKSREAMA